MPMAHWGHWYPSLPRGSCLQVSEMSHVRSPQKSTSFEYLDDYVKRFVRDKTGLSVRLDLQTEWVALKPQEANGSIALAIFWAKVLQHRDNYPTEKVHYHRSRDSQTGADRLVIRVEDVTISLNLSTGLLEITGPYVLVWLKKRFLALLRAYDGFKDTANWYDDELDADDCDRRLQLRAAPPDRHRDDRLDDTKEIEILADVWQGQALDSRLERSRQPTVQATSDFVYPLVKSLLSRWLSDENTQVCLVTTELDSEMLKLLCQMACHYKATASFSCLCVPFRADPKAGRDLPAVRLTAMQAFPAQEQMWLEYKLLRQFTSPATSSGVNLLAGLRLGHAQALITSAPFHSAALMSPPEERRGRADLVQFVELSEKLFLHDFIQPLNS